MRKMVYDWTGQRTRRLKAMRMATIAMLLVLLASIPAMLLH
ncbi:hypothetical protein [Rhizobium sp. RAF56]